MPDNNSDNPYAPPESVEEMPCARKFRPARPFGCVHVTLLIFAAPLLAYYALSPILFMFLDVWESGEMAFNVMLSAVFVVVYCMMIMDKTWAYGVCALYACWWTVQSLDILNMLTSHPEEGPPFDGVFVLLYFVITTGAVINFVLSLILMFSSWMRKRGIMKGE